ncbi:MAG TPA: hypothetical protein VLJ79_26985 [Candidatus Binatia bacterium]|nr:hypothetical protein [Candidatus Binatia bacterium]
MKTKVIGLCGVVIATLLPGCAGQPQQFVMQQPDEQKPQTITFPNGTTFGGASGSQASTLAKLIVDSNNNNMKEYEQLQGTAGKNLQTSQQALRMLEHLSEQQGTGEITLFFPTGSTKLPPSGLQYQRLINFVDYLSRNSRGGKILFVMIGSASATGSMLSTRSSPGSVPKRRNRSSTNIWSMFPTSSLRCMALATCTPRRT